MSVTEEERAAARGRFPSKPRVRFSGPGVEASAPAGYSVPEATLAAGAVIFHKR